MKSAAGLVVYKRVNLVVHYLLLQTSYGIHHWSPPKGHVDPGEDVKDTAIRETTEEAGFKPADLDIQWDFKREMVYPVNGKDKRVTYWLAELKSAATPVVLSAEHQDFRWLPLAGACQLAAFDEITQLLQDAEVYLSQNS